MSKTLRLQVTHVNYESTELLSDASNYEALAVPVNLKKNYQLTCLNLQSGRNLISTRESSLKTSGPAHVRTLSVCCGSPSLPLC